MVAGSNPAGGICSGGTEGRDVTEVRGARIVRRLGLRLRLHGRLQRIHARATRQPHLHHVPLAIGVPARHPGVGQAVRVGPAQLQRARLGGFVVHLRQATPSRLHCQRTRPHGVAVITSAFHAEDHGFESRWGYQLGFGRESSVRPVCEHLFVAGRKAEEREKARALRRTGASLGDIAAATGCAKSTVSLWVRDIDLTDHQAAALEARNPVANPTKQRVGSFAWSRKNRELRAEAQEHGRALAQARDPLHLSGCMLYWAEGSKNRNQVTFTNSDVDMVVFFLEFLRRCYDVADERVMLSVNCFLGNGFTLGEIETWWRTNLDLPESCLRKAAVNRASRASKKVRAPLLYGTARIAVSSTFIVQSIYGAIQEYTGAERPEWLDLGVKLPAPCLTSAS